MSCYLHTYNQKTAYWFPWNTTDEVIQALEECNYKMVTKYSNGTILVTRFDTYSKICLFEDALPADDLEVWCLEVWVNDDQARWDIRPIGDYRGKALFASAPLNAVYSAYCVGEHPYRNQDSL